MAWKRNLLNRPDGTWRSLGGAADEQTFVARATGAGFYMSFKVWRDMPYDAVLDYDGALYRVEIKGTTTQTIDLTRGGRSGTQMNKGPEAVVKKHPITQKDCDFVAGVRSVDDSCYIIPVEVVEILAQGRLEGGLIVNIEYLERFYKEKWSLFTGGILKLSPDAIRRGFRVLSQSDRDDILNQLNLPIGGSLPYRISKAGKKFPDRADAETLQIWERLGE